MLKQSDIADAALTANAKEQCAASDPTYIDYLRKQASEWQAVLVAARKAEREAARIEAAAGFRGLSVTFDFDNGHYLLEWQEPRWKADKDALEWRSMRCTSFLELPEPVTRYMLEHHPDLLPDAIARLVPDDPAAALAAYIGKLRAAMS